MRKLFLSIFCLFSLVQSFAFTSNFLSELDVSNRFVIPAEKVDQITHELNISKEELMLRLISIAKPFARPSISHFQVGAVGLGKNGNLYLGVNLEFPGFPLNQTVHGEQFLIVNARNHGEEGLVAIAVSAAPCGHCRQFLNEIGSEKMQVWILNRPPMELAALLPESFGPKDLGVSGGLMTQAENKCLDADCSVRANAILAANSSYAPYSQAFSGIAIQTQDGNIYRGSYLENAAFNPSLSPFQAALVALLADMHSYDDIKEVILVEKADGVISQVVMTELLLKKIAPHAVFKVEKIN